MLKDLASIQVSDRKAQEFITKLFNTDKLNAKGQRIMDLYQGQGIGAEFESSKGTAYGLLNAFTQWHDWEAGKKQDGRIYSAWFGGAANAKTVIADKLLELA